MQTDEEQIRDLVATWMTATAAGDIERVGTLMTADVVFLTPGNPPMRGRDVFIATLQAALQHVQIEGKQDIQEIQIQGDMAWMWNLLTVTITPVNGGAAKQRTGYTLSILQKQPDGRWLMVRDANMLT